jgi:hypothetical protein
MDNRDYYEQDGYQKGFDEARRTGGKVRKKYIDNYIKTETRNLPTIYAREFIKGWDKGFTDGVTKIMSRLVKKDDFWGSHICEAD